MTSTQPSPDFKYTPIVQTRHEIRTMVLLRGKFADDIICEVRQVSFDDSPIYEALSYTWGERTDPEQILLGGVPFTVSQNLALALRHLRLENCDRDLWVDAICINQDDSDERNNQVQQMSRIYEAAKHVHVWLGPENEPSRIAMGFLEQVNTRVLQSMTCQDREEEKQKIKCIHQWIKDHYHMPENKRIWDAISCLWQRNYWSRIWIIQEVVFGTTNRRQCMVHCGHHSITWETLAALDRAMALIDRSCSDNEHSEADIVQFSRGARLDLSWFITVHGYRSRKKELPLSYLLLRQGRYQATDSKDKVYALLSMVPESMADGLVVDYKLTTAQVYTMAMREMVMREKRLGVLCACCRECRRQESLELLPTWCPDFSTDPMDKCCPARLWSYTKPIYYASGEEDADAHFLMQKGVPMTLIANCWYLDTIKVLSYEDQCSQNGFLNLNCLLFMVEGLEGKTPKSLSEITPSAHETVWRTLVANRGHWRDRAPEDYGKEYMTLLDTSFGQESLAESVTAQKFLSDDSALNVPGPDLLAATSPETRRLAMPFKEKMATCLRKRRICRLQARSCPGLVPDTAETGDIICILVGCALPLVLRKAKDHFVVIGESYVHGFMSGEILDLEKRGEVHRKRVVIC